MPRYRDPYEKGRLIIQFQIDFPKNGDIDVKKLADLEKFLPPRMPVDVPKDAEEHLLTDIDPTQKRRGGYGMGGSNSDDEDMPRGQRVQCANQ